MNHAFIDLLTDPLAPAHSRVLGLDAPLIEGLRMLSPVHRDELAAAPLLLADLSFPVHPSGTQISYRVADDDVSPVWLAHVDAFANRLLAALWHFSRMDSAFDSGLAGFCMGLDAHTTRLLGAMSFAELSRQAPSVCASLRARHAEHPSCWPDLIRLVADGQAEQLNAARLGMIPLTVATQQLAGEGTAAR